MRLAAFALLCTNALSACDRSTSPSDAKSQFAIVDWMDWPAEVAAGQAFRTRMVVPWLCAIDPEFHAGAGANLSSVTFKPFFTFQSIAYCAANQPAPAIIAFSLDTAGIAPGLPATSAREYRMQALTGDLTGKESIRSFGTVRVLSSSEPDASRRNAAGWITTQVDSLGCLRITPRGLWHASLVLENPADTANLTGHFVMGYIYESPLPICGETMVFHLDSRN